MVGRGLPAWPLVWLFCAFPVWWYLGLADLIWIPIALIMAFYLARRPGVVVPRQFGVWLLFIVLMLFSVIELDRRIELFGFADRAAIYLSTTVIFVYTYNARISLPKRTVAAVLTGFWLSIVLFGFADVLFPRVVVTTPGYQVVSRVAPGLLSNDLVSMMFIRHLSSYSADAYFTISPRPSAPFVYANNWGNAYSLLLPIVVAFLIETRVRRHLWWFLVAMVPLSAIPAFLTLNRGMFIGLGIAVVYASVRLAMRMHIRAIVGLGALVLIGLVVYSVLPVKEGLQSKEVVSTTTRASLYSQSLDAVSASPIFGYGAPIRSTTPGDPPVGTQGQFWMLLVSHGPAATACFVGFFAIGAWRTRRVRGYQDLAFHTVMLVGVVELAYYGVIPYGLPLMMAIAGVSMRPPEKPGPELIDVGQPSTRGPMMVLEA